MNRNNIMAFLLTAVLSLCSAVIPVHAAEQTADGVKLVISSDRTVYDAKDKVVVRISLENNSGSDITDVSVKSGIPSDYHLAEGSNAVLRATYIQAGGSVTGEMILVPDLQESAQSEKTATSPASEEKMPQSTDPVSSAEQTQTVREPGTAQEPSSHKSGWLILFLLIPAAMLGSVLGIKKKRKYKSLAVILCISAAGALYPAEKAKAAEPETQSFSVCETITAAGKTYELKAEVTFTIAAEDMQAAVAEYYEDNSDEIVSVEEIEETKDVFTEKEAIRFMTERGFTDYPLTYDYDMDGTYADEAEASAESDEKHPMYQTYFVSEEGAVWTVFIVGKKITANPASYNLQSDLQTQVLVSETETLTSYTEMGNKLYTTIPKESAVLLRVVDQITSEKLNELTYEEVIGT